MSKCNYLVSIIIINYNNTKYLERAINSSLNQTYQNIEILVFDDKSEEKIFKIEEKFNLNTKVKFFHNENKKTGIAAIDAGNAYDFLIKKSNGELIFLLDSDDYFHEEKVNFIKDIFDKNENISFIQNLNSIKNKVDIKILKTNSKFSYWPYFAPESCISFRKDFYKRYKEKADFLSKSFNDLWLGFRMGVFAFYVGKNFYQINKILTYYENFGESLKYKTLNYNWWQRRKNSFEFAYKISNRIRMLINFDYLITSIVVYILNIFKK
tara:strand:+ start:591 stop:1391 length:801 start_codon:yes stop_codon:yes gene_type:complete